MIETFHLKDSLLDGKYSLFLLDSTRHKKLIKRVYYNNGLKNGKYFLENNCVKRRYRNDIEIGKEILKDYEENINEINWYDKNGNKIASIDYYYIEGLVAKIKHNYKKKISDTIIVNMKYKKEFLNGEIEQLENKEFWSIYNYSKYTEKYEKK
jgi:hypothetical protein